MITEKFGLQLPEQDDYYDITEHNANLKKLDSGAVLGVGVDAVRVMTAAEYAALTAPEEVVLYIVTEEASISMYLGALPLSGSGSTITPSAVTFSLAGTSVTATPGDAVFTESEET